MAVCDMSSKNSNVFYELGMRQAFDLPTVLIKDEITDAPFDISGLRYVTYKKDMSYRDVKFAVQELTEAIKDTYRKKDDKSEINSLIRLMELANPAKINHVELSEEARYEKLNELHLKEVTSSIDSLIKNQNMMIERLEFEFSREARPVPRYSPPQQPAPRYSQPPPPPPAPKCKPGNIDLDYLRTTLSKKDD